MTELEIEGQWHTVAGVGSIRPMYDRILVLRDPEEEAFAGTNIVRADAHKEKPLLGTVLAVGEGRLLDSGAALPSRLRKGDRIMYGVHAGLEIPDSVAKDMLMMREDEVMAVIGREK